MIDEILQLGLLGITETIFDTVKVEQTLEKGIPIGKGKCKAVRLQLNQYVRNSVTGVAAPQAAVYFGDSQAQNTEILRSTITHLIVTDRLEKIFVRNAYAADAYIQVWIYR
jgi:hypothetical protein